MQRIQITDGLEFSRLVYGMWRLVDDGDASEATVRAKVERCLEQGITTFDQADIYGLYTSEEAFGQVLKATPSLRDQMEIVTKADIVVGCDAFPDARVKYYDTSAAYLNAQVDKSLAFMGIEQIDVLLVHRQDPFMDHLETGAALDALIASGKVAHVGVSNFRPWDWDLLQSGMKNKLVTNQIELSVFENAGFTNGDIAHLQRLGVRPMAWSPLAGGRLFTGTAANEIATRQVLERIAGEQGVGTDAVAIAWLMAHPSKILPVMGSNNLDRITSFNDALKVEIDRMTWFEIYEAANGQEVP